MKKTMVCSALFSVLLVSPLLAQSVDRVSVSGEAPPEVVAIGQQSSDLSDQGEMLLRASNFRAAEQTFREAMTIAVSGTPNMNPSAERGLAEALVAEGKSEEAAKVYRTLIYTYPRNFSSVGQDVRTLMRFASLLSQMGHWPEAVSVYEKAFPKVVLSGMPKMNIHFDSRMPMPIQLQAMTHVACGIQFLGSNDTDTAFREFAQGSSLAPDLALANFYCGFGWQQLDLKNPARKVNEGFAKAALQKAAALDDDNIKKATEEAMNSLNMRKLQ